MATAEYTLTKAPYFLQVATGASLYYSAEAFREYTGAYQPRAGILGYDHLRVVQSFDVGWELQVLGGYANLRQTATNAEQHLGGLYTVYHRLNQFLTIPWRPPGSGTRTHKVFVAVFDPLIQGSATVAKIMATEDVGSGAPDPVGATGYLQLATFTMVGGQANLQDKDIQNIAQHGGDHSEYVDLTLSLASGYSGAGFPGGPDDFRGVYSNGTIRLSGMITKQSGNFPGNTDTVIGTLPPGFRPKRLRYLTGACSVSTAGTSGGTFTWRLTIAANGTMTARIPSTQAVPNLVFDGMTYDLD